MNLLKWARREAKMPYTEAKWLGNVITGKEKNIYSSHNAMHADATKNLNENNWFARNPDLAAAMVWTAGLSTGAFGGGSAAGASAGGGAAVGGGEAAGAGAASSGASTAGTTFGSAAAEDAALMGMAESASSYGGASAGAGSTFGSAAAEDAALYGNSGYGASGADAGSTFGSAAAEDAALFGGASGYGQAGVATQANPSGLLQVQGATPTTTNAAGNAAPKGLLGQASEYVKPAMQALGAANTVKGLLPQTPPIQSPQIQQNGGGPNTLQTLATQAQEFINQQAQQSAKQRAMRREMYSGGY